MKRYPFPRFNLFIPYGCLFLFFMLAGLFVQFKSSPDLLIKGKIVDQSKKPLAGATISAKNSSETTTSATDGTYSIKVSSTAKKLVFALNGYITQEVDIKGKAEINITMLQGVNQEVIEEKSGRSYSKNKSLNIMADEIESQPTGGYYAPQSYGTVERDETSFNTESYNTIQENEFLKVKENPLSTFSIDVDAASYANSRRYLNNGGLPPVDAVRVEEFINYFDYTYPQPKGQHPFEIYTETSECPWNKNHQLIHVGLQGKRIPFDEIAPMNLVFLIDVSGSMGDPNKLPLVKSTLKLLVNQLRSKDHISLTVYAGAAGLVLPSTSGSEKEKIIEAIDKLESGGSTAGGEGLKLAYKIAKENFIKNGINRVILASDGDFNVGVSSDAEMTRLIESKRDDGIFMTVLGFGMGNYKDSKMESIADNGNGNYFYIDQIEEARKVLVTQLDGTLYTIAKDVKIQIEFNPANVKSYRLVGYENRLLKKEDFNNDKKDAGELGAGHTVTALYEIVPINAKEDPAGNVDELKYQKTEVKKNTSAKDELMTIKFRYKNPSDTVSKLIVHSVLDKKLKIENTSENFRFASSVAMFGMLLRNSKFKGEATYDQVTTLANNAKGKDEEGYRAEFIKLVKAAKLLAGSTSKQD